MNLKYKYRKVKNFTITDFLLDNLVPILFLVLSFIAIPVSGLSFNHIKGEI